MGHALFVILALGINAAAMGPWITQKPWAYLLLRTPAQALRTIERKLNRPQRTLAVRRQRGILLLAAALLMGLALGLLVRRLHIPFIDVALLALLLPVRPSWDHAREITRALQAGDVAGARLCLKDTVWRHYALLDDHALARAAIEMLAVHFSEKILAPALWYLLFGMPGFLISKSLYLLQENLCQPLNPGNGFSRPIALTHMVVNFVPARLAALLWLPVMVLLPSGQFLAGARQVFAGIARISAPEALSVLAAAAAARLSLGGPTSVYTQGQWLGSGSAKATAADVMRMLYAFVLLLLLTAVILGIAAR